MKDYIEDIYSKVENYVFTLLKDFTDNPAYADAFSAVFLNGYSIEKLISEDKNITSFSDWDYLKTTPPYEPGTSAIRNIETKDLKFDILSKYSTDDLYYFFKKKEFSSEFEAKENFPSQYFYIDFKRFWKKTDDLFFSNFADYEPIPGTDLYEKAISKDVTFILSKERPNPMTSIEDYYFPLFYIKTTKEEIQLIDSVDVSHLLFIPGDSFIQFYIYSTKFTLDENSKVNNIVYLRDQPCIYHNNLSNKYTITNTPEKLVHFNSFIYLSLELSVHYFRVLERWLISVLENQ